MTYWPLATKETRQTRSYVGQPEKKLCNPSTLLLQIHVLYHSEVLRVGGWGLGKR